MRAQVEVTEQHPGGVSTGTGHIPVMLETVLEGLRVCEDGTYVDCTAGGGGHAEPIAARLTTGRLIALDRDPRAVEAVRRRLAGFPQVIAMHRNYGELAEVLQGLQVSRVDGVLVDAGLSSPQLDDAHRGFSFQREGPLDMRMDPSAGPTAEEYLATVREEELTRVLKEYGDIGPARRVAAAIRRRREGPGLHTTHDLVQAVCDAFRFLEAPPEETRTVFQAIRIAVNRELEWLESGLRQAIEVLSPGGRLVVIAFHSGEDRMVKNVLREASRPCRDLYPDGRVRSLKPPTMRLLTAKPLQPDEAERARNPRCHSAKLRIAERLPEGGAEALRRGEPEAPA